MGLFSRLFKRERVDYSELIANGAKVIDVRSKEEFRSGHFKKSVNLPLQNLATWSQKLKKDQAVILVCRSGARAGIARRQLSTRGITAYNAGAWQNLQ